MTDVSDGDQVDELARVALEAYGAVHLVCNNAGVGGGGQMQSLTTADWQWVLGVNLWGVIHGMRVFLPLLTAQDEGHIVNTASIAGLMHAPFMGPYNASKAAVVAISETAFHELRLSGSQVGISVLCPSWVRTRIHESARNRPEALRNGPGFGPSGRRPGGGPGHRLVHRGRHRPRRRGRPGVRGHGRAPLVDPHPPGVASGGPGPLRCRARRHRPAPAHAPVTDPTAPTGSPAAAGSTEPTGADPIPPTIEWLDGGVVRMIDQRLLPGRLELLEARTVDQLCVAIAELAVRGAPALGAAGAMGVALAVVAGQDAQAARDQIVATRPTAVNLAWGADRALAAEDPVAEAVAVAIEDVARNRRLGAFGAARVPVELGVLTHCNAGALACVGYGTALGVIRAAHEAGLAPTVWVDETRPVLQGARLTAWELERLGIPATLVADVMAGSLMASGDVDLVVVGADRVAANGDVANKIGTYSVAVLAQHHGVPFYVAMPTSTIDPATPDGSAIVVERRDGDEVRRIHGQLIAPATVAAENRAFDITPAALVTGYVTEQGILAAHELVGAVTPPS